MRWSYADRGSCAKRAGARHAFHGAPRWWLDRHRLGREGPFWRVISHRLRLKSERIQGGVKPSVTRIGQPPAVVHFNATQTDQQVQAVA